MIRELTNHVWQSTVFAAAIGLLTFCFRQNRAHVRYWLWLSASIKFLLPFSLLIGLGSQLDWAPATQRTAAAPAISLTMMQVTQPFPDALPLPIASHGSRDWIMVVVFGIWACGFVAIALIRFRDWRRIQAAVRSSIPDRALGTTQVRTSPGLLEPGVVGWFRPILLLPDGLTERLQPAQLKAVLAHELCHVQRRDNLSSAIHMIVEAVFWVHPLVWWIGARMVEERERACDEAVVNLGNAPRDYADGILNVCKSYVESPLSCVSGVTGSNLKRRLQAILAGRIGSDLSIAKKLFLTAMGAVALTVPVAVGVINAPHIQAQSRAAAQKFVSASIKSCPAFHKGSVQDRSSENFHSECTTVQRLIQQAYGLFATGHMNPGSSLTVTGGPAWITSNLYQVDAQAEGQQSRSMMNGPMLQTLLEDRLKLNVHRETREVPVYSLTLAAGGPKLDPFKGSCTPRDFDNPPSDADCGTAQGYGNGFVMNAVTMADLCAGFSALLNRPVVDRTGMAGRFTIHVQLSGEDPSLLNRPRALVAVSDPTKPAPPPILFSAMKAALKKVGLNLEPSQGPGEFIVIDHIERPSGS